MSLNWFLSKTVRHATHMRKHVGKLVSAQRDLLTPQAIEAVTAAMTSLEKACASLGDKKQIEIQMTNLENVANKWLKPYPNAALRENIEVLLVAIAVAMGIRTFVAQPFKIPTGSMQPTLYGVTSNPDFQRGSPGGSLQPVPDFDVPNLFKRFFIFWTTGIGFNHVVAKADGTLDESARDNPTRFLLFNLKQDFNIGGVQHTAWFPPDRFLQRAGLLDRRREQKVFRKGDDVVKMVSISGDHLFVDRLTYNFRRPKRGEIIVFETRDISEMELANQGQFYIKRLLGLGGERLRIGDDRHVYVDGKRLDASNRHFEKVYSFGPTDPPTEGRYSGHVNGSVVPFAKHFPDGTSEFAVPAEHYVVMGDNTMNSSDSRFWGSFPKENVIGRSFFVYWPFGGDGQKKRAAWGIR